MEQSSIARPILFNEPMVRAILSGRKTQTRRLAQEDYLCRYGAPGDKLWVRETFCVEDTRDYHGDHHEPTDGRPIQKFEDVDFGTYWLIPHYRATEPEPHIVPYRCDADDDRTRWRPSIHMPRWASRISLTITDVRTALLHDIDEADALREGIDDDLGHARQGFIELWESIYGTGAWARNPIVWVVSFGVDAPGIG